jgi:putative oxidoreductase
MDVTILPRSWAPYAQAVMRIMFGLLFLQHGLGKIVDFPHDPSLAMMPEGLKMVAGLIEIVGGLLLITGFLTRIAGFVMAGFSAVAYFMVHFPMGFFPELNHGDLAVIFCFVGLFFATSGAGAWSVDRAEFGSTAGSMPLAGAK